MDRYFVIGAGSLITEWTFDEIHACIKLDTVALHEVVESPGRCDFFYYRTAVVK